MSDLCLNFWAKWSKRSSLKESDEERKLLKNSNEMNFSRPHETVTVLDQRVSTNRYMPPRQNRKERVKKYLPHHFREEPLLKRFLTPFQAFPCIGDILKIKRNKTKPKFSFRIYKAKISSFHQPKRKKKRVDA